MSVPRATIEDARVLSKYEFGSSIVYLGLSGEEQGLWGGQHMAQLAREQVWDIVAVLNNDMIGNRGRMTPRRPLRHAAGRANNRASPRTTEGIR